MHKPQSLINNKPLIGLLSMSKETARKIMCGRLSRRLSNRKDECLKFGVIEDGLRTYVPTLRKHCINHRDYVKFRLKQYGCSRTAGRTCFDVRIFEDSIMVRKKLDNRIRTLIENGIATGHRSMFVVIGEKARDQVVLLHHILTKATVSARPSVLWCYKKELGFSSHRKKRMREIQKNIRNGKTDEDDPFEIFISSTDIRYCYYSESNQILGNTYGMLILQDFEAITPNILARTIETVQGGGLVVLLLQSINSLRQLYTMTLDVHNRYRTEAHQDIVGRFCERFILSLGDCQTCVAMNDQLEVLPISSHIVQLEPLPPSARNELSANDEELAVLKSKMADHKPIGPMIKLCKTLCQAKVVLRLLDLITERSLKATASVTAARGRGKSAALGLVIAGAISLNFTNVFVTSPSPENLRALFEFLLKGFEALQLKEYVDYEIQYSQANEKRKCVVAINVFRNHKQTIQYIEPTEASRLSQAELLVIDEAAAIPLPFVKALISGPHMSFLSSTINGYEGTGRSLSLKLLKQLRQNAPDSANGQQAFQARTLHEMTLEESIRYKSGDEIEKWLYKLLCLDAPNSYYKLSGTPPPDCCELYYVNRDTLFSYHKASESFLSKVMSIFVSAHYKNSPDDLQMLSDAPSHHLFVLMSPVKKTQTTLPEILAAVQVCMEGRLSSELVTKHANSGRRAAGDLIPWTISQYFLDTDFAQLSAMGYGTRALQLLRDYYEGKHSTGKTVQQESFVNLFRENEENGEEAEKDDEDDVRPAKGLPPLLCRLNERSAEQLDYLGVSYGVNVSLLKFWKKNGFVACYLRPTPNELTGDHTCIMLKNLQNNRADAEYEKKDNWVCDYFVEFRRRFLSLLSYDFREFSPHLALSIMQLMTKDVDYKLPEKKVLSRRDIELFLSNADFKRISKYAKNMADYHLITDLLPTIALLYFGDRIDSSVTNLIFVELSIIQSAILLSLGLQRKNSNKVATELNLPVSQVLALFSKAIHKFSTYFDQMCVAAIEESMKDEHKTVKSLKPTKVSLQEELKSGEQEVRQRQKRDRESLFAELGISDALSGNEKGQLSQFAIKATDDEWAGTLRTLKLSNAKPIGIVSVKAPKRPADAQPAVTNEGFDEASKAKKSKTDNKKSGKKKSSKRGKR
ncbi:RNA cytidine acetyltransferase [Aphelenchoides bicaudatus]|nr:RNA cytidine acetyltransferase [Aphelenchoides bicaudatus]